MESNVGDLQLADWKDQSLFEPSKDETERIVGHVAVITSHYLWMRVQNGQ